MSSLTAYRVPRAGATLKRAWFWFQTHEKTRWTLLFLFVCTACYVIPVATAWADSPGGGTSNSLFLPLDKVTDTHGVPISRYVDLPMDPGNGAAYVLRSIRYVVASILWMAYAMPILLTIAAVNWILEFEWLGWLAAPFEAVTDGISSVLGSGSGTPALITLGVLVSALVITFGYIRGRTGAATVEFAMVVLVFGLVTSSVINPFNWLAGDTGEDAGLIEKSADFGQEAGGLTISNDGSTDTVTLSSSLADLTLRDTMLTMAFGFPLTDDKEDCGNEFDKVAKDADKDREDIRKTVIKCNDDVKDANQTDDYVWLIHYLLAGPAALGVIGMIGVFLFFLLKEVVQTFISAVAVVIRSFLALFPGGSRQALLNAIAQIFVSIVIVAAYIWALNVYMWLVAEIFTEYVPVGMQKISSVLIGVLMIVLAITYWKMKKAGKSIGERIAKALGRTGMAKDFQEPAPSKFGSTAGNLAKGAVSKGIDAYNRSKMLKGLVTAAAAAGTGGVGAAATTAASSAATGTATKAATRTVSSVAARSAKQALPSTSAPAGALPEGNSSAPAAGLPQGAAPTPPPPGESRGATANASANDGATQSVPVPAAAPSGNPAPGAQPPTVDETTVGDAEPRKTTRVRHIPAGRHGNTWVHRNGQITTPQTITETGKPVRTVPAEDKIQRAWKDDDSWVVTDAKTPAAPKPSPMRPKRKDG